jgi:3-deoxy-D-manno-octulosonate 8-phosphate phosphatase (KDO 8-P phosphatase)
MPMDTLLERAKDIRLLVLDVDGVLTDGRLCFSARGEEHKYFHVRDGAGMVQLLRSGVQIAVISGRESRAVDHRMTELGISWVRQGVTDKLSVLRELFDILNLGPQAVASVGDDSTDLPIFEVARLAIAVGDAHASLKAKAHFITQSPGGQGAVREVCDLIIDSQRSANV